MKKPNKIREAKLNKMRSRKNNIRKQKLKLKKTEEAANTPVAEQIFMKVRSSLKNLKTRDRNNKLVKRKGKLYVINKKNPRMNMMVSMYDKKDTVSRDRLMKVANNYTGELFKQQ